MPSNNSLRIPILMHVNPASVNLHEKWTMWLFTIFSSSYKMILHLCMTILFSIFTHEVLPEFRGKKKTRAISKDD